MDRLLKKSTQNITCQLYTEMNRLVRLYASNLLKAEAVTAAGDDLRKLSFTTASQLADENLVILGHTLRDWKRIMTLNHSIKQSVDFIWPQLGKINAQEVSFWGFNIERLGNPDKVTTYSFETIKSLAKRFPQLD